VARLLQPQRRCKSCESGAYHTEVHVSHEGMVHRRRPGVAVSANFLS
jgi:hypothetical protein